MIRGMETQIIDVRTGSRETVRDITGECAEFGGAAYPSLRAYAEQRQAGSVADEPATARALADFVLRGLDCGAVDATEVREGCGLDDAGLRSLAKR